MAKSPTFNTITAAFASASKLNANNDLIVTAFDNTLSLDGSTPNAMGADFDMGSNDILNVGDIQVDDLTIGGISVAAQATASASSATASALSAAEAAVDAGIVASLTEFTSLTDVPNSYASQGNKFVKVNGAADALEFISGGGSEPSDGDKGDITVTANGLTWSIDAGVVDTTELASNAVTTAKLASNGITLAKMEHGTTGDILFYGASGEPFRLAKGSDNDFLKLVSGLPEWASGGIGIPWQSVSTFYDFAIDGVVASVETPTFLDGFEYAIEVVELSHNNGSSQSFRIDLFGETDAAYLGPVALSNTVNNSNQIKARIGITNPREVLNIQAVLGVISTTGLAVKSAGSPFFFSTAQKVTKARITYSAGSIDAGVMKLFKRAN